MANKGKAKGFVNVEKKTNFTANSNLMVKSYQDQKTGRVFEMNPNAFERFMSRATLPDGRLQYVPYNGEKKNSQKDTVAPPPPSKAEVVAQILNQELQAMTASQLVKEIQLLSDLQQLQALSEDKRKTVAAAAQKRLADVAEGVKDGGE